MRSNEERQFLHEAHRLNSKVRTGDIIRSTFTEMFGEVAATAAISFTGDGQDDIEGFASRTKELYGDEGARSIFERLAVVVAASSGTQQGESGGA